MLLITAATSTASSAASKAATGAFSAATQASRKTPQYGEKNKGPDYYASDDGPSRTKSTV